ncbi:MAG: hypothetical protein GF390_03810 [Candidatus Pacebacteria bacterium]|nr:hypothetical protein [Candidatus Paceibacterota bacterium]
MTRRKRLVSSRLAKREQKKLTKQTIVMLLTAIAIFILFVFVVMPGVVKLFFNILDSGNAFEPGDDIPPQVPVLQAPVTATYSASLNLTGYGEPRSEVVFVLNGSEVGDVQTDDQGQFDYDLDLDQGQNDLVVYGVDAAGNESAQTRNYQILMDQEPPVIELEQPQDGAEIELKKNQIITIKGKTEPYAKVYINGRLTTAGSDGSFNSRYQLHEGENKLEFKAIDKAGNQTRTTITVKFRY